MKYTVDRIENGIAVLISIDSKKIFEVDTSFIDLEMHEGDVVVHKDSRFFKDDITKEEIENRIKEKLNKAKSN